MVLFMVFLCASLFAGTGLNNAAAFVKANYDRSSKANPAPKTTADFEVFDSITIKNVKYSITWSTDTDLVKVVAGENGIVRIDIDEAAPEDTVYNLIATIRDSTDDSILTLSMPKTLPRGITDPSYEEIVLSAYRLGDGEFLPKEVRLSGTVVGIPTAYNEKYGNVTVDLQIGAMAENIIQCYRLSGEGSANIKTGDVITVEGKIKNYKGTIEFDKPTLVGKGDIPNQSALIDEAYMLADGEMLKGYRIIMGTIDSIQSAWSDKYGNITVNIIPTGDTRVIQCFRLKGEGASALAVGDTIAVVGSIKNYKGTIEFDKDCMLVKTESFRSFKALLKAYELEDGKALEGVRQVRGTIVSIPSAYNEKYGNITVNLVVDGVEALGIQCYRLNGGSDLAVGDTITVSGTIKNYKGTIEFDKNCTYTK